MIKASTFLQEKRCRASVSFKLDAYPLSQHRIFTENWTGHDSKSKAFYMPGRAFSFVIRAIVCVLVKQLESHIWIYFVLLNVVRYPQVHRCMDKI